MFPMEECSGLAAVKHFGMRSIGGIDQWMGAALVTRDFTSEDSVTRKRKRLSTMHVLSSRRLLDGKSIPSFSSVPSGI